MTDQNPAPDSRDLSPAFNQKLIALKERWAREGRGLTETPPAATPSRPRLPPGQHLVRDFPVLDLGTQPNLVPADWSLTVSGAVERPLRWDWRMFLDQPQSEILSDIHCVTTWSRYDNLWTGVTARHLLRLIAPRPEARFVVLRSWDGYATNLPLARFAEEDVLLAHSWQGQPLSREHGGPVRVVVPRLYFWKSAKWLRAITVLDRDAPGYWEARGYHDHGDPWLQERYR